MLMLSWSRMDPERRFGFARCTFSDVADLTERFGQTFESGFGLPDVGGDLDFGSGNDAAGHVGRLAD